MSVRNTTNRLYNILSLDSDRRKSAQSDTKQSDTNKIYGRYKGTKANGEIHGYSKFGQIFCSGL